MARKQWYFAYGSNLDLQRYESRIKRATDEGIKINEEEYAELPENDCETLKQIYHARPVTLSGYTLAFNKERDGKHKHAGKKIKTAFSNIMPHKTGKVHGVIYSCTDEDFEKLDDAEGAPDHYERKTVKVVDLKTKKPINGKVIAYIATENMTTAKQLPPSDEYLDHIITGAKQHGLPTRYITSIDNKVDWIISKQLLGL